MKYRSVGVNIDVRPKEVLRELGAKLAGRMAREFIILFFKCNRSNIGVTYNREHFEKHGRLKPRGYPYDKKEE